jgi:hypothetical protein
MMSEAAAVSVERIDQVLDDVYAWSRSRGYLGYNKHDGLNSPILRALFGRGQWPRMIAIQGVMRSPINLRPLLMVAPTANPKGLALFARGLLDRYQATGTPEYLLEARELLTRLRSLASPGEWSGLCWGYPYPGRIRASTLPPELPTPWSPISYAMLFFTAGR